MMLGADVGGQGGSMPLAFRVFNWHSSLGTDAVHILSSISSRLIFIFYKNSIALLYRVKASCFIDFDL
jgi:hypothetical protein